ERKRPVGCARRQPRAHVREQAPGPGAIDADRALDGQDGVLEYGQLQTLLGLEPRPAEEPVTELRRQQDVRFELGVRSIVADAQDTLHRLYPPCSGIPESSPGIRRGEHLPDAARRDPAQAPPGQEIEQYADRLQLNAYADATCVPS